MVLCKYCAILYRELEHPQILIPLGSWTQSPTDTEGRLSTTRGLLTAAPPGCLRKGILSIRAVWKKFPKWGLSLPLFRGAVCRCCLDGLGIYLPVPPLKHVGQYFLNFLNHCHL